MPVLLGENIQLGVGKETTRGTAVAPTHWLRGRVPTSLKTMLEKQLIKETKGTRANSQDSIITAQRVEGDFEFNVRNGTIGYFLLSLLGSVASAEKGGDSGVYDHTFTIDVDEPRAPALTAAIARGAEQHYQIPLLVATSLQLTAQPSELVFATAGLLGKQENEVADYTPAFASDDHVFPRQGVSVKIAANVAGLGAAEAICLTELSLNIANGARVKQCLGSLTPNDIIALMVDVNGSLQLEYSAKEYYDWFKAGSAKAMEITIENTAETIGASSTPKIVITLPKVTLEGYDESRPIDDIASESLEFVAHYDDAAGKQIDVVVTNEESAY